MKHVRLIAPLLLMSVAVMAEENTAREDERRLNEVPALERPSYVEPDDANKWAPKQYDEPIYSDNGNKVTIYTHNGKFEGQYKVKQPDVAKQWESDWKKRGERKRSDKKKKNQDGKKSKDHAVYIKPEPIGPDYDPRDRDREENFEFNYTFTWK